MSLTQEQEIDEIINDFKKINIINIEKKYYKDRLTFENINYIIKKINKCQSYDLVDKKIIFKILFNSMKNNKNLNDKIYYLSHGVHGITFQPSLIYKNNTFEIYKNNFISKIINNNNNNNIIYNINKEYKISNILKKLDPNNKYFIYIDEIYHSENITNLIIKKGYEINMLSNYFTEIDIFKIFFNCLNGIEILKDNNILLLDIKSNNMLLNKSFENVFNLVFIDFSGELVVYKNNHLEIFIEKFCHHVHDYWPYEINKMLSNYYEKKNKRINYKFYKNYSKKKINKKILILNEVFDKHVMNDIKYNLKLFYEKVMIFQLGKTFKYLIKYIFNNDSENIKKLYKVMNNLVDENYNDRYTLKKIKEKVTITTNNFDIYLKLK